MTETRSTDDDVPARRLVKRFYEEVWNKADEAVAREILHDDLSFRGSLGVVHTGREGFLQYMRATLTALAEYECVIEDLIASETRAAARMTFTGIHRGVFFGVPGTGRRISWAGNAFFSTDGRQITELSVLGDIDAIKRQLGIGVGWIGSPLGD